MHRGNLRSESRFPRRPSYNPELEYQYRDRSQNRDQDRQFLSPEPSRSQRYQSRDQNQGYHSHKSQSLNPNRRYPDQRYQNQEQTRRYQNQSLKDPFFIRTRNQDPRYLNVNGFYDQNENSCDQHHQDRYHQVQQRQDQHHLDQHHRDRHHQNQLRQDHHQDQIPQDQHHRDRHHQERRTVEKSDLSEVVKDEAHEKNLRNKRLRERDINNRVVTESSFARPIPVTPRYDQHRDRIVWSSSRSKADFQFGSNSSLPSSHSSSQPLTSSPATNQGEATGVPAIDLSIIKGPIQQSEQTATKEKSQELHIDDKPVAKMPRIVTMERKRENGKKDSRPSDDLENVSEEDGEISDSSDDDIILLEDNGNEVKVTMNRKDDNGAHKSSKEPEELCEFHRHTVTTHDYKTLADEEFLNDAIVNFYLTYLYEQLSDPLKEAIHIFSSHFYSRLKGDSKSRKSGNNPAKTQAEKSYDRVKSWTRKIDIFAKRMLIYPICEESHWYTVIVCNPGMVLSAKRTENYEEKREAQQKLEPQGANPFIMVLDSLGGSHSSAVGKIRSYLQFEHLERKKMPLNFGREKMNEKHPPIPQQPNSCDCGVFLLHYVELIFRDPAKFLGAKLPDLSQWFSSKEIDYKREDIALLIRRLSKEQKDEKIKFPSIKFPAKRPKTASPVYEDPAETASDKRSSRNSDPRLRRFVPKPSDVIIRQIRITKNSVATGNDDSSSIAIQGPRPSRFSLEPKPATDNGKRTFEDWSRTTKFSPGIIPRKTPVCTIETSTPRSSSRVVERSSRDQTRYDASDNNLLFGVGPAESAKRRKTSSSSWRVVGPLKEEVMRDERRSNDEDRSKKKRFVLNRAAIDSTSRSKGEREILTSSEMFEALMESYPKNKKS